MKRDYLPHEMGESTIDAMRKVCSKISTRSRCPPNNSAKRSSVPGRVLTSGFQIKQAFDPLCLLNCDKVVRMQKPKKGEVDEW